MLIYATLFTLAGKIPKDNKYIAMFYIWFSYLKKYAGLGPGDTVGVIIDEATLDYFNKDDNPYFSYIANDINFELQLSIMPTPATLSTGCGERYNMEHFSNFTKHDICLYTDIDCLSIRNIHPLFKDFDTKQEYLFVIAEVDEGMTHDNYAGNFIKTCPLAEKMHGFSSGWFAWTWGEATQGQEATKGQATKGQATKGQATKGQATKGQATKGQATKEFFANVSKALVEYVGGPLYTVDQPFFNYEIYLRVSGKVIGKAEIKICIMDSEIVTLNPLLSEPRLAHSYFANFCGEPGVEDCHFYKLLTFMCVDFSTAKPKV
jgi:hypothetical protein